MKSKGELRRDYLIRRRNMPSRERERAHAAIRERVLAMTELAQAPVVLTYVSSPPEVDTRALIDALLQRRTRVLAPVMSADDDAMRWGLVESLDRLVHGPYGMSEPSPDSLTTPPADAPVLVPLVAFTARGDRLGRGGGHFDRFLAAHAGKKIGLAYECQRAETLPVEPHDARLDVVVTEIMG